MPGHDRYKYFLGREVKSLNLELNKSPLDMATCGLALAPSCTAVSPSVSRSGSSCLLFIAFGDIQHGWLEPKQPVRHSAAAAPRGVAHGVGGRAPRLRALPAHDDPIPRRVRWTPASLTANQHDHGSVECPEVPVRRRAEDPIM